MKSHCKSDRIRFGKKTFLLYMALVAALVCTIPAHAAVSISLSLSDSAGNPIAGENSQQSLGRENTIECFFFSTHVGYPIDPAASLVLGDAQCVKNIDKSSPKLMQLLSTKDNLSLARFRFFRPNPSGDGTLEQFYTIELREAHIVDVRPWLPNTTDPATAGLPPMEAVTFDYGHITTIYTNGGIGSTIP